jgi:Zn-finger nucleic acid-binding protein
VATRRCAACFDLNLADDRNCRRCGSLLPEEDSAARPERLACAGCGASMTPRVAGAVSFDECDHCGGIWLSPAASSDVAARAETRALLRPFDFLPAGGAIASGSQEVRYRKCPLCEKLMNRSAYAAGSGVIVDVCKQHGSHFDRGELARIFTFIESGGMEKARRREAEELREEVREARRKAISIGASESSLGLEPISSGRASGLDLLLSIARHLLSKDAG